jgi:uncharacterized DUF497 family protein
MTPKPPETSPTTACRSNAPARLVFADPFAVGRIDDREDYGEDRFTMVGMVEGTLIFVAYTERGDRVRIITARRATRHEQDDYFEQNARTP